MKHAVKRKHALIHQGSKPIQAGAHLGSVGSVLLSVKLTPAKKRWHLVLIA